MHEEIRELLAGFVLGELSENEAAGVAGHLAGCDHCRQEVRRLEKLLECTGRLKNVQADPKACADALRSVMAAVSRQKIGRVPAAAQGGWRAMLCRRSAQFAVAAAVVFIVVLGITLTDNNSEVAWGGLAARLEKVSAYIYEVRYSINNYKLTRCPRTHTTTYYSSNYGIRNDVETPFIEFNTYTSFSNGTSTLLYPYLKKYVRWNLTDDQLQRVRELNNPANLMKYMMSFHYTRLGRQKYNGLDVDGIEVTDPRFGKDFCEQSTARLLVSVATGMPVYFDIQGSSDNGEIETSLVFVNFEWNARLDADMFEPNIPEDYILTAEQEKLPTSEDIVIRGLRMFAEMKKGRFPSSLVKINTEGEVWEIFADKTKKPGMERNLFFFEEDDCDWEAWALLTGLLNTACTLYGNLVREEKDVAYYGRFVTADMPGTPLMRWKASDNTYRVIWSDLHATTIRADELAEAERALQQ